MSTFPELRELKRIIEHGKEYLQASTVCEVAYRKHTFPVYKITMGNPDPAKPAIGLFGGVHGLERIGTQVLLSFLRGMLARLKWDKSLQYLLQEVHLVLLPLVNPGGMWQGTRCNLNGVDLMRNSPVVAEGNVPFLLGGQRISPHLPWYRGRAGAEMEVESLALIQSVREELLTHPFSVAVDCHSGFGLRDHIWFPHAHTVNPIRHMADILALENLFHETHPNTRYVFEPQSLHYQTHGDLWDYLYLEAEKDTNRIFLPLTLEMGSWLWVKKNPRQLLSLSGIFNPMVEHRQNRVLRRHTLWLDFLLRATAGYEQWIVNGPRRCRMQEHGVQRWYRR